ncbi:MAG: trypsin-like peptidase domain-containing protein [Actinomycetota bacterium]|nr:trypsin-like peptidase domain-containing protein [Actinomycetota bacterium]
MKKISLKILILTVLVSLLVTFSFMGCSLLANSSKARSKVDEQSETTGSARASDPESGQKSNRSSESQEQAEIDADILSAFDNAVSSVADKVKPSVVNIKVTVDQRDIFGNLMEGEGEGSGVIYGSDGYIITNNHVAGNAKELVVTLNDGTEYPARLIGTDENTDIAVIKIEATGLVPAEFTPMDSIKVGEMAIAVGSPFGLQQSVTVGVVSAIGRDVAVSSGSLPMVDLIQTDAAINPGNSGGALVNSDGQVMGINSMIYSTSGSNAGIGFAIPGDTALNIAEQLIENGVAKTPFIGIEMGENTTDIKGVYIQSVTPGYPAEKAGIKAGDIITAFDGKAVETPLELFSLIITRNVGDEVTVSVSRNGQSMELALTIGEKPQQTG